MKTASCKSCAKTLDYREMAKIALFTGISGTVRCRGCGTEHYVSVKSQRKVVMPLLIIALSVSSIFAYAATLFDPIYYILSILSIVLIWFSAGLLAPFVLKVETLDSLDYPRTGRCRKCGRKITIEKPGLSTTVKCSFCYTTHKVHEFHKE